MMPIFENLRERIRRRVSLSQRGQIQVGGGALVGKAKEKVTSLTAKAKELRPGIIPKLSEKLAAWYPGKRISSIVARPQLKTTVDIVERPATPYRPRPEKTWVHY